MNPRIKKINAFLSYSHKDIKYKNKLLEALKALGQSYNIITWHDGMIDAGENIDDKVKNALNNSQLILLLITNHYINSYYCMEIELKKAHKRVQNGECIIIPIIYQESCLTDKLCFYHYKWVPEDGKPITKFKSQSLGCTRAVKMIQELIDNQFPNCKCVGATGYKRPSRKKQNAEPVYIELYQEGSLKPYYITQPIVTMIQQCHSNIHKFRSMMDQALITHRQQYLKIFNQSKKGKCSFSNKERLQFVRAFLMDICAYTKQYITGEAGFKVHFRISKDNYYLGLIASIEKDSTKDLQSDWTTKMTPIPMYNGLIYYSSCYKAPLVKSLNTKLNFKTPSKNVWKDYVTFTFPGLHNGQTPMLSYCISIHSDYYKIKGELLKVIAYLNLGEVIEHYLTSYFAICKHIDKSYDINNIIQAI